MAPSSTRMRSAASVRSVCSLSDCLAMYLRPLCLDFAAHMHAFAGRPQSEQMTDRVNQVGAVHGVEMKIGHPVVDEIKHLLSGDGSRNQLASRRIIIETMESVRQPIGDCGAGAGREILRLLEVLHRQNSGHDRDMDTALTDAIEIAEIERV